MSTLRAIIAITVAETAVLVACLCNVFDDPRMGIMGLLAGRLLEALITLCLIAWLMPLFRHQTPLDENMVWLHFSHICGLLLAPIISLSFVLVFTLSIDYLVKVYPWYVFAVIVRSRILISARGNQLLGGRKGTLIVCAAWYHQRMGLSDPFPQWFAHRLGWLRCMSCAWSRFGPCGKYSQMMEVDDQVRNEFHVPDEIWSLCESVCVANVAGERPVVESQPEEA
jgi:hypothetical protein